MLENSQIVKFFYNISNVQKSKFQNLGTIKGIWKEKIWETWSKDNKMMNKLTQNISNHKYKRLNPHIE